MNRRTFLHTGVIGTLASSVLSDVTLARAQAPAAGQVAVSPATPRRLVIDAYSRHLHWLRSPDEIAAAAIEMTCTGIMPTVQAPPGHIDPAAVATALPQFVAVMRQHNLRVKQIRGGNQTAATDAGLEAMVGAMGQAGVTHYWVGTDNYNLAQPILPQLDAIKSKIDGFVKLNQKHGTTLMYHTRSGANSVGAVVWDLLYVMKDFDPKYVGFHWDTGHMAHHGAMWETLMRTAAPYILGVGWKDRSWSQQVAAPSVADGAPVPAAPAAGARRGGGPGAGAGAGRGGAGRGGAGRGGGGGIGGGWTSPWVPMGTGLVDIARYATVLRDIGFDGPMELEAEYPNGGADAGSDTLTLPRQQVIENMKRDVLAIRTAFAQSGTGLTI